jgi:hypothetical protein
MCNCRRFLYLSLCLPPVVVPGMFMCGTYIPCSLQYELITLMAWVCAQGGPTGLAVWTPSPFYPTSGLLNIWRGWIRTANWCHQLYYVRIEQSALSVLNQAVTSPEQVNVWRAPLSGMWRRETTRRHVQKGCTLHSHLCKNLISDETMCD